MLGGGHSIGIPLAVAARHSFIVPTATMTVHPVRHSGMVLGVPTLAVLAALLKQAVGAGLTARGLDENGEPRRNLPGGPQEN